MRSLALIATAQLLAAAPAFAQTPAYVGNWTFDETDVACIDALTFTEDRIESMVDLSCGMGEVARQGSSFRTDATCNGAPVTFAFSVEGDRMTLTEGIDFGGGLPETLYRCGD